MSLYKDKQNQINKNYNKYRFLKNFVVTSLKGAFADKSKSERRRLKQEIGSKTIKLAKQSEDEGTTAGGLLLEMLKKFNG